MKPQESEIIETERIVPERNQLIHTFGALAELGQEISNKQNFGETIRTSLHLLLGSLGIMRGAVARFSKFGHELNVIAVRGLPDDFPLTLPLSTDGEAELETIGLKFLDLKKTSGPRFVEAFRPNFERAGVGHFVPLIIHDELVGMVVLGQKASGDRFSDYDREVVSAMSRHIGVAMFQRNMMAELERRSNETRHLYENLRLTYSETVMAFAAAIDRKDKYTEGHSVRVGKYTEMIAAQLGWSEPGVEGAAVAGYLHDVGKITVERKIINAPYRIDAKESSELNKHPGVGYEILMPISHPYTDVPLAAKYHHERIDGRGYPDGLYDREIPYIAKIVNVADSFDAMTTDRPYKRRRPMNEVCDDLMRNSGKQFAPEIVIAFLRGMYSELTGESKTRPFRKLLGREYMETEGLVPILKNAINELSPTSSLTYIAVD